MNQLPQIFRQTQHGSFSRQGPFFNLRLNQTFYNNTSVSLEKSSSKKHTKMKLNRYSVDRPRENSRKKIGYKTISYDHLNDPQFYGTKGKKDQSQSYNVLIQERRKAIEIMGFKVAACRGFKELYQGELIEVAKKIKKDLKQVESSFLNQLSTLRQSISHYRRETASQIKTMKLQLKQFTQDLLYFCQQSKKVQQHHTTMLQKLQQAI